MAILKVSKSQSLYTLRHVAQLMRVRQQIVLPYLEVLLKHGSPYRSPVLKATRAMAQLRIRAGSKLIREDMLELIRADIEALTSSLRVRYDLAPP